ncbi:GNAT family N-acetyltransferase [Robiginitalea sp.]|nr:GNAT family N-acetyltransferase [Robiginitalea sp.]
MDIIIREATEKDIPVLLALEQVLVSAERPFDPTIKEDPVWYHDISGLVSDSESRFVVAESLGRVVACAFGIKKQPRHYLDHDAYAYLGLMVTAETHRGKGINGLLINDLKQWAITRGLYEMRLTVYDGNQSAIRAYEKAGFERHIVEMRFRVTDWL